MRLTHTLSKGNLTRLKLLSQVSLSLPNNNYKMTGSPPDKQPHVLNPSVIWQLWPGLSRGDSRLGPCSLISFTTLGKPPHLRLSLLLHLGEKNLWLWLFQKKKKFFFWPVLKFDVWALERSAFLTQRTDLKETQMHCAKWISQIRGVWLYLRGG